MLCYNAINASISSKFQAFTTDCFQLHISSLNCRIPLFTKNYMTCRYLLITSTNTIVLISCYSIIACIKTSWRNNPNLNSPFNIRLFMISKRISKRVPSCDSQAIFRGSLLRRLALKFIAWLNTGGVQWLIFLAFVCIVLNEAAFAIRPVIQADWSDLRTSRWPAALGAYTGPPFFGFTMCEFARRLRGIVATLVRLHILDPRSLRYRDMRFE